LTDKVPVKGLRELDRNLKTLPDKIQRRTLNTALVAGARVVIKAAQARAPSKTGATKRNIASRKGKYKTRLAARRVIGVVHGKLVKRGIVEAVLGETRVIGKNGKSRYRKLTKRERNREDPFYWRFQELGYTAVGRRKARGRAGRAIRRLRGKWIPGRPFLTPALENNVPRIIEAERKSLVRSLKRLKVTA